MLYIFDLDGTLISPYMKNPDHNYDNWSVLPGITKILQDIQDSGDRISIVTNQAGVAFGYITRDQCIRKIGQVVECLFGIPGTLDQSENTLLSLGGNQIVVVESSLEGRYDEIHEDQRGKTSIHICYGDMRSLDPRYNGREAQRRKPSPEMIQEAMFLQDVSSEYTVYIGDMGTDEEAAKKTGVKFLSVEEFMGKKKEIGNE